MPKNWPWHGLVCIIWVLVGEMGYKQRKIVLQYAYHQNPCPRLLSTSTHLWLQNVSQRCLLLQHLAQYTGHRNGRVVMFSSHSDIMYFYLCCLIAIKCKPTCFIKHTVITCCVWAGESLCLWSQQQVQHPKEVLTFHPHLNQHFEICQSSGFYLSHPKSLNEVQTLSVLLQGQDLAGSHRYTH